MSDSALEFTGERFTPECVREIWYEHWHRYAFAVPMARDRRVLDRLKDKHEGEHRALETHRDRMMMDEIALARFTRMRDAKLSTSSTDSGSDTAKAAAATNNATSTTSDRVSDA